MSVLTSDSPIQVVITEYNAWAIQVKASMDILRQIKNQFAVYADGYVFMPEYKSGRWDGKIEFFNTRTGLLSKFFYDDLLRLCRNMGYSYSNTWLKEADKGISILQHVESMKLPVALRENQVVALTAMEQHSKGIILSATGSGKTYIIRVYAGALLVNGMKRIIIVFPKASLVTQTKKLFHDVAVPVFQLGGGSTTEIRPAQQEYIVLGTYQTLRKYEQLLHTAQAVIVDECHGASSTSQQYILSHCVNARYRWGFTGTLPEDYSKQLLIQSQLEKVRYTITSKELADTGILTPINVIPAILDYPNYYRERCAGKRDLQYEQRIISGYHLRDRVIVDFTEKLIKCRGGDFILLFRFVDQQERVYNVLVEALARHTNVKVHFVNGAIKVKERDAIFKNINTSDEVQKHILVGTFETLSTGLDIPSISTMMFCTSYKSSVTVLQSVGRAMRLYEGKDESVIVDIIDNLAIHVHNEYTGSSYNYQGYAMKHGKHRMKTYRDNGFGVSEPVVINMVEFAEKHGLKV